MTKKLSLDEGEARPVACPATAATAGEVGLATPTTTAVAKLRSIKMTMIGLPYRDGRGMRTCGLASTKPAMRSARVCWGVR